MAPPPAKAATMRKVFLSWVVLLVLAIACGKQSNVTEEKIDALSWRQSTERRQLAQDLIRTDAIAGKTKEEVIDLLGIPQSEDEAARLITYVVGMGGSDFNQVWLLDVRFDDKNKVQSLKMRGD